MVKAENQDSDKTVDEDPVDETNDPDVKPQVTPKGKFATTEHSLKKHKPIRYFRCPSCGMHKSERS